MPTLNLTEYPDLDLCKSIWRHPEIKEEHRARIKSYCDEAIKNGCVQVKYETKGGISRFYPKLALCATYMWGRLRATLFGGTEQDVDIVNCHACLLLDIVEFCCPYLNAESLKSLKEYVENRDLIVDAFPLHRNCPYYCPNRQQMITEKKIVKSLFNIFLYGGTTKTWIEEWDLNEGEFEITDFVRRFL